MKNSQPLAQIDVLALLASYENRTWLAMYDHLLSWKAILKQVKERNVDYVESFFMRLSNMMTLKTCVYDLETKQVKTSSILSRKFGDAAKRDTLIKLGRMCPEFTIFTELASQACFERLIDNISATFINELNNCFQQKEGMKSYDQSLWPNDLDQYTGMHESMEISNSDFIKWVNDWSKENS